MGTQKPRSTISFDEDNYDNIAERAERTGKKKSDIVNDACRDYFDTTTEENFLVHFGQGLFFVGFVIAYYSVFTLGLAVSFIGFGLMVWSSMQNHLDTEDVGYAEAFKRTIGVH